MAGICSMLFALRNSQNTSRKKIANTLSYQGSKSSLALRSRAGQAQRALEISALSIPCQIYHLHSAAKVYRYIILSEHLEHWVNKRQRPTARRRGQYSLGLGNGCRKQPQTSSKHELELVCFNRCC